MKDKVPNQWIIKMRLKSKLKLISGLFATIFFLSAGCSKKMLEAKDFEEIKLSLNCTNVDENKTGDYYYITTTDSKLSNEFGREMAASVVCLLLYERIYQKSASLEYNSTFGVKFSNYSSEFKYSLNELSSVSSGKKMVEELINDLIVDSIQPRYFIGELSDLSNVEWSKVNAIGATGFEHAEVNYYNQQIESILFRYFVQPINKEIWFYYSAKDKKIISVIEPINLINTEKTE